MKKTIFTVMLLLCFVLLFSCSGKSTRLDDKKTQELRLLYKNSSVILRAKCEKSDQNKKRTSFVTQKCILGKMNTGTTLFCEGVYTEGREYFLFLSEEYSFYTADKYNAFEIAGDRLIWDGKKYNTEDIELMLSTFNMTVSIPSRTYFYDDRKDFLDASDAIIIGTVSNKLEKSETNVRLDTAGAHIEITIPCVKVNIKVAGSLRGEYKNGDTITMMYVPSRLQQMTDASTESTVSMSESDVIELNKWNYYIFFMKNCPDTKQNYLFPVNPVQGWMQVKKDDLIPAEKNELFTDCKTVDRLYMALNQG